MKLEAIDPLNLSAICVATIRKVTTLAYFEVVTVHMTVLSTLALQPKPTDLLK